MRAFTVTTTKLMQNKMWATRMVRNPRLTLRLMNNASNDEPITTSGVAIGRKIRRVVGVRPRNRGRASAKAMRVPRIVAAIVDRMPIFRLRVTDEQMPGASQTWLQFLVVKPCQVKLNRPRGLLNENRMTMTIGRNRKARPRKANIATLWSRIHRTGRVFIRAPLSLRAGHRP